MLYYLRLFVKGILIGSADIIPGISGSSIALMTGIYTDLIRCIKSIDHKFILLILQFKFKNGLVHINGKVLIPIVLGIPIGIYGMSEMISILLSDHQIAFYGTLFGLLCGTALLLAMNISQIRLNEMLSLIVSVAIVLLIQALMPTNFTPSYTIYLLAGLIAGCFMILPGISGSLILVTMGIYTDIVKSVSNLEIGVIACVASGAIISIFTMSRILTNIYYKATDIFFAIMIGLIVGSTPSIWPWNPELHNNIFTYNFSMQDIIIGTLFIAVGFSIATIALYKRPN